METTGHLTSYLSTINDNSVELYFCLKSSGMVSFTSPRVGQMFIWPSFKYIKLIHVIKIRLIVDSETWKRCAKCSSANPRLSLHIAAKNSSIGLKDLDLPLFLISSSFSPSYTAADTFKFNFETQYDIFCPSFPGFKYLKTASMYPSLENQYKTW